MNLRKTACTRMVEAAHVISRNSRVIWRSLSPTTCHPQLVIELSLLYLERLWSSHFKPWHEEHTSTALLEEWRGMGRWNPCSPCRSQRLHSLLWLDPTLSWTLSHLHLPTNPPWRLSSYLLGQIMVSVRRTMKSSEKHLLRKELIGKALHIPLHFVP